MFKYTQRLSAMCNKYKSVVSFLSSKAGIIKHCFFFCNLAVSINLYASTYIKKVKN